MEKWDFSQWLNTIKRLLQQKLSVVASKLANSLLPSQNISDGPVMNLNFI